MLDDGNVSTEPGVSPSYVLQGGAPQAVRELASGKRTYFSAFLLIIMRRRWQLWCHLLYTSQHS
jgi:hypothetical protein